MIRLSPRAPLPGELAGGKDQQLDLARREVHGDVMPAIGGKVKIVRPYVLVH
jgi:hypothetical protein